MKVLERARFIGSGAASVCFALVAIVLFLIGGTRLIGPIDLFGTKLLSGPDALHATAAFGGAAIASVVAFISRFRRFKGLGVEMEMWERKMEEAATLVDQLRSLALTLAKPVTVATSRLGEIEPSLSREERHDFASAMSNQLRGIGAAESAIGEVLRDHHRVVLLDLGWSLINKSRMRVDRHLIEFRKRHGTSPTSLEERPFQAAHGELDSLLTYKGLDWADHARSVIGGLSCLTPADREALVNEVAEELADIEGYERTRQHRRLEVWLSGSRPRPRS